MVVNSWKIQRDLVTQTAIVTTDITYPYSGETLGLCNDDLAGVSIEWTSDEIRLVKVCRSVYDLQSRLIEPQFPTPVERIRAIMQERSAPRFIRDLRALNAPCDIREVRARETLKRVIGDNKYRDFLRKGFITVTNPKSGNTFQIFPGNGMTNVYFRGKMVEKLCVVLQGDFPPTDSLIMRYLMVLNNEQGFRAKANVFSPPTQRHSQLLKEPGRWSLVEIFSFFKNPLRTAYSR